MTSKSAILAAAIGDLFVLAGPAFSADDAISDECHGMAQVGNNDCASAADQIAGAPHATAA